MPWPSLTKANISQICSGLRPLTRFAPHPKRHTYPQHPDNSISTWQAQHNSPICSMYGIFTYIWVIFRANVGKYSIHGAYGSCCNAFLHFLRLVMRDHATDEVNCRITDKPGTFATTITTITTRTTRTTSTTVGKQTSVSQHVTRITRAADCFSAQPVWNRCQHPHTKRGKTRTMVKLPVLGKSLKYIEIY